MSYGEQDTICAIATAPGRAGVGIIRLSGPAVDRIGQAFLGELPPPRTAQFRNFTNSAGEILDAGLVLFFPAPASFTGEDVLELHGHGGIQVMNSLRDAAIELGARLANPGEFSERAFLNNKIDLTQAEAIADLIDASSKQAARSAVRTLKGEFSRRIDELVAKLISVRVQVEAAIDFPDEEIEILAEAGVIDSCVKILQNLDQIEKTAAQGAILRSGINVVLAGAPNVGKSSLLNRLSETDAAIVTEIPGTTRDVLTQHISIDGLPVHIIDTAGLRVSPDPIEEEGIRRAASIIKEADRVLVVVESSDLSPDVDEIVKLLEETVGEQGKLVDIVGRLSIVRNKIDLHDGAPGETNLDFLGRKVHSISLSALTDEGIDLLRNHLKVCAGFSDVQEDVFAARERHLNALAIAKDHTQKAMDNISEQQEVELVAEELRLAQLELDRITGQFSSDDLLGEIFSNFCVGK